MSAHKCTGEDYPPGGVNCFCIRGENHDESLFGVPVSRNPEPLIQRIEVKPGTPATVALEGQDFVQCVVTVVTRSMYTTTVEFMDRDEYERRYR